MEKLDDCHGDELIIITPLAMIPKPGTTKRRMIRNLSAPVGASVNDFIPAHTLPRLHLVSIDDLITMVLELRAAGFTRLVVGRVDVDNAYRRVPVKPAHRWQLGLKWGGVVYRDATLPMGLRSSCHAYQRITLAIVWHLARLNVMCSGYLDDIIHIGPEALGLEYRETIATVLRRCGLPPSEKKLKEDGPPAPRGKVLGYLLDLDANTAIPQDKKARLVTQVRRFVRAKSVRRNDLSKLVCWLGHLLRIVPSMRHWCGQI